MSNLRFESAGDVPAESVPALKSLLYRLADDDLMIGHRNSEWTGLGPILEADIAFSSIAQDQIGQAQAYYALLHELGEDDPNTLAFMRDADAYRCAAICAFDKQDWAFSTVRLFLYDTYKAVRLTSLCSSSYAPLAQFARKVQGEQKYHLMHANMWMRKLGPTTDESHSKMQAALDQLYAHGLGLFEPAEFDADVAKNAFCESESDLCDIWTQRVSAVLEESGLMTPSGVKPIYGGRVGKHPPELQSLLDNMQQVYRLDPAASW